MASNASIAPDKILGEAAKTLALRGAEYDGRGYQGGERSMDKTCAIFEALTGIKLSEVDGWRFMMCLKLARSTTGRPKLDTYVDIAGYASLTGEAHLASRLGVPDLPARIVTGDPKGVWDSPEK